MPSAENKYNLEDRLVAYAVQVIALTESLPATRVGNHEELIRIFKASIVTAKRNDTT